MQKIRRIKSRRRYCKRRGKQVPYYRGNQITTVTSSVKALQIKMKEISKVKVPEYCEKIYMYVNKTQGEQ